MSAATSPSTHQLYGVQRVCRIVPRSTFYQARRPANAAPAKPRGPRPPVDDESLLAAIRADLAASPFRPGKRRAGLQASDPGAQQFILHAQLADPLVGGVETGLERIVVGALLQARIH